MANRHADYTNENLIMNQGWSSNIFQLSRLISCVNETRLYAIKSYILNNFNFIFHQFVSIRTSAKIITKYLGNIDDVNCVEHRLRLLSYISYINNHNSISSWRRNRKKIQANGAIYFFSFFLSSKKKKFTGSPIVREDRSMKIQAYSWRFTLSGTRFCYSVGRKVGAAEEAGSKLHKCESFRAKDGEKIRADCNEDIGNFTVLFLCFSRIAKFSRINSRSIVIVREILEFLRRRSIEYRVRKISSLNFFSIKLKWSKVNQIWQINLQNSKIPDGQKGIVAYILLSFPRVSLLYLSNELFFQEQLQYSPHKMQEGWVGSRLRWKRETATRELWEAKWSSQ